MKKSEKLNKLNPEDRKRIIQKIIQSEKAGTDKHIFEKLFKKEKEKEE